MFFLRFFFKGGCVGCVGCLGSMTFRKVKRVMENRPKNGQNSIWGKTGHL